MNSDNDKDLDEEVQVPEELTSDSKPSGIEAESPSTADEGIHEPFDPDKIDVKTRTITLDLVLKRVAEAEIDLMPDFQRRAGIWDLRRKSQLIESLLLRIPLPVFYVAAKEDESWSVVDGLQRLTTLKEFILDKSFYLVGLEFLSAFHGKKYDQLSRQMQRRILETEVTIHVIQPGTPATVMFNIFKRINTGGMPLSPQEIRHALLQGRATRLLKDLAESAIFKKATRNKIRDERMGDRECVLRFAAFHLNEPTKYSGSDLDSLLVNSMKLINGWTENEEEELRQSFARAMDAAIRILGQFAFRKYYGKNYRLSPINKALFEVWSVEFAKLNEGQIALISKRKSVLLEKFSALMLTDYDFVAAISVGTGDSTKVRRRFSRIAGLIKETLDAEEPQAT